MRNKRIGILWAGAAFLILTTVFVALVANRPLENRFAGSVRDLLPEPPPGWTMVEKPIADTPEMKEAVGELLNYDDGILVDYLSGGGSRVSAYIAYWRAGKMSSRLVAGHTPDVCWVNNGWKRIFAEQTTQWGGEGLEIPAAQVRAFEINGQTEHVVFWHLSGGESVSYGTMGSAPWYAIFSDLLKNGLNQNPEQFFFRISAPVPLDEPMLQTLVDPIISQIVEVSKLDEPERG
ncbi:MAG: hypothetical protein SynsKO_20650 [Synoicihabitans sp.]